MYTRTDNRKAVMFKQTYCTCKGFTADAWVIINKGEKVSVNDFKKVSDDFYVVSEPRIYVGLSIGLRRTDGTSFPSIGVNVKNKFIILNTMKKILISLPSIEELFYTDEANNLHMKSLNQSEIYTILIDKIKEIYVQFRPSVIPLEDGKCDKGFKIYVKNSSTYGYLSIEEFEMLYYSLKESNIPIMGRLILLQSHLSGIMELSDKVFSIEEANPEDIPGIDFDKLIKPSTKKWIPEEHGSKSNV